MRKVKNPKLLGIFILVFSIVLIIVGFTIPYGSYNAEIHGSFIVYMIVNEITTKVIGIMAAITSIRMIKRGNGQ